MILGLHLLRAASMLPALLALPAALAQPAQSPAPTAATACSGSACTITVRIDEHCRSGTPGMVIDPVIASTRQRIVLRWWLANGAYEFNDEGIAFDDIAQFERLPSPNSVREIRMMDSHSKLGDFRYVVRVRGCPDVAGYIRHE